MGSVIENLLLLRGGKLKYVAVSGSVTVADATVAGFVTVADAVMGVTSVKCELLL